ncbi:unnamed protein product [Eruca vesicaria subsp. sativa]|uniref:Pectinesterase inhibitor domain-containing protein n=1 Tax=Eruca vesicaria subsp. sativa TaxID=29727 RepID=A0ABC8JCW2_ERUVS|nr:unnamed protein product [Eruca vesicaria subsp. sativa]
MVAYDKKNFSLAPIVVLIFLVVSSYARFNMMVTKDDIKRICTKKDINSVLCFEILKLTPETAPLDFSCLAKYLLDYQYRNISDALEQFKLAERNTTNLQAIKLCEELYGNVLYDKNKTLSALADKDYDMFNMYTGATGTEMHTCSDELSKVKPIQQVLITRSLAIEDISDIILVILECFIREPKLKCRPDLF